MKKIVLAALLLAGCVDAQRSELGAYDRIKGKPISNVVLLWGKPETEVTREQGTIYTFTSATNSAPTSIAFCRINVYTNHQGLVVGLRHQGATGACADMYSRLH